MKRKFYLVIFSFLMISFLSAFQIYYTSGCAYHSGSPADGLNCGSCHAGGLITPSITMVFTPSLGIGNTYNPNTTYTVTVLGSGYNKYGFDLEILNSNSSIANSVADFGTLQTNQSDEYINTPAPGYTYSDIMHSAPNSIGFTFIWTAPATGTGYLYCALLGVDNNGNTSGDKVNTKTITLNNAQTNSVSELMDDIAFKIFPNPVAKTLSIENFSKNNIQIKILDAAGKTCFLSTEDKSKDVIKIDLSNFLDGIYFISINDHTHTFHQKIMVNK